jgi:hypothetical protein
MGQQSSALIESLPSYCKEEARKSKQCMYKFDYKRYVKEFKESEILGMEGKSIL